MRFNLTLALTLTMPFTCLANNLNYSYVEGGWNNQTLFYNPQSHHRIGGDGGYLNASWQFNPHAYVFGGFSQARKTVIQDTLIRYALYEGMWSLNRQITNRSVQQQQLLGIGFHTPIAPHTDFLAELSYSQNHDRLQKQYTDKYTRFNHGYGEYETFLISPGLNTQHEHTPATALTLGMRGTLFSQCEGWIKASYTSGSSYRSHHFSALIGGQYALNPQWGIVAQASTDNVQTQVQVGLRKYF